ncbi:hypothetical protein NpPPO83_00002048 [Neofusicoccum parvum]|uniref:Uncharacterized protein n=1 Tax=Neofusicoccum parvum TaxID=310453 RepID=A0ACB5SHF1_9PEZI|nr:hypothetical protein NpPPO83_00002048 [Neofusicoccum parvum]
MFATHQASSSNAFYCDPQAVKKLLGKEEKPHHGSSVRATHVSDASVGRKDSVTAVGGTVLKFVEPEKHPKETAKPRRKRQRARTICSMVLRKLKS